MIYYLLSPLTWTLLLTGLAVVCWHRMGKPWRIGFGVCALAIVLLFTPLGANQLVRLVESGTARGIRCDAGNVSPIVLLSGGLEGAPRGVDDYAELTPESWVRLRGAVDLWHRGGGELVVAGGGPFAVKESDVLSGLARSWSVAVDDIRVERQSTTTWESAMALRGTLPVDIRLASSALHLPRALTAFRAAGFRPCLYSTDSAYLPPRSAAALVPQSSALVKSESAIYELVGGLAYRLRAWRTTAQPATTAASRSAGDA